MRLLQKALVLALLVAASAAVAAPPRPAPTRAAVREAKQLWERAQSLRHLQIPLLKQRATRAIGGAMDELERAGVKVDRKTPVVLDSSREYATLRQTSALLRGARPGTAAYQIRKSALLRARELQHTIYGLPRQMNAYTNAAKGEVELAINLDSPFYGKPEKLLPIIAHEHRHIRDANRALRLERLLAAENLAGGPKGAKAERRTKRLQGIVDRLWTRPRAEVRAFEAQAFALALTGRPLGFWWRAPAGGPIDQAYPPERINHALLGGYFKGLAKEIAPAMAKASPLGRKLASEYLAGYKSVLKEQSIAYHQIARKDAGRDPGALERYNAHKAEVLASTEKPGVEVSARLAGQLDAFVGAAPSRVKDLVSR